MYHPDTVYTYTYNDVFTLGSTRQMKFWEESRSQHPRSVRLHTLMEYLKRNQQETDAEVPDLRGIVKHDMYLA